MLRGINRKQKYKVGYQKWEREDTTSTHEWRTKNSFFPKQRNRERKVKERETHGNNLTTLLILSGKGKSIYYMCVIKKKPSI